MTRRMRRRCRLEFADLTLFERLTTEWVGAMAIKLPPDIEATIQEQVERGRYTGVEEVVREALRLLTEYESRLDEIRAKVQIGVDEADRGEIDDWTPELRDRLRQEADLAYRHEGLPDPDVAP